MALPIPRHRSVDAGALSVTRAGDAAAFDAKGQQPDVAAAGTAGSSHGIPGR